MNQDLEVNDKSQDLTKALDEQWACVIGNIDDTELRADKDQAFSIAKNVLTGVGSALKFQDFEDAYTIITMDEVGIEKG
jgi:hypothetical protein